MKPRPALLRLPTLIETRLETWLANLLFQAGASLEDFLAPAYEPALMRPASVSWRVFKNPLSVFIGGVAAVVLELAEPRVRTGVWEHTRFRQAPLERLQRTGYAAMMTVYGPCSRAQALIQTVNQRHARIEGRTPSGTAYRANDPELLAWVQATASFGFIQAYTLYADSLTPQERDQYYAEGATAARLYGVKAPALSERELQALFDATRPGLEASDIVFDFLRLVQHMPALAGWMQPLQLTLVKAAVQCVPPWARERLGLTGSEWRLARWQQALLSRAVRAANRRPLQTHPAVLACRRQGVPEVWLYHR